MSEALSKRSALPAEAGFSLPPDIQPLDPDEKYQPNVSFGTIFLCQYKYQSCLWFSESLVWRFQVSA